MLFFIHEVSVRSYLIIALIHENFLVCVHHHEWLALAIPLDLTHDVHLVKVPLVWMGSLNHYAASPKFRGIR